MSDKQKEQDDIINGRIPWVMKELMRFLNFYQRYQGNDNEGKLIAYSPGAGACIPIKCDSQLSMSIVKRVMGKESIRDIDVINNSLRGNASIMLITENIDDIKEMGREDRAILIGLLATEPYDITITGCEGGFVFSKILEKIKRRGKCDPYTLKQWHDPWRAD